MASREEREQGPDLIEPAADIGAMGEGCLGNGDLS